jgi:hypothetical protein
MASGNGVAILSEGSGGTKVMRGRDVQAALMGRNMDPVAVNILVQLAEINHTNTLAIAELATMFNSMVDTMQSFGEIAENMKTRTDQFVRATDQMKQASEGNEEA